MVFVGYSFLTDEDCSSFTPTNVSKISSITLKNGIFDDLYITKETDSIYSAQIPKDWDFDTILHTLFQGTLHAGNVDYTISSVSEMRVKRREVGTYDWVTLYQIPISHVDDFNFERMDMTARAKTWYEYSLVPVINNVEGNLNINKVYSDYDGIFIVGSDEIFGTYLNTSISVQNNHISSSVTTLGRKYPYIVSSSKSNYTSGNISGTFIEFDRVVSELVPKEGWKYRKRLMDFFGDGKPKIIKVHDGRMWMSSIIGSPSESAPAHEDMPVSSIEFVETGDVDSGKALYYGGFIDTGLNGR